MNTQQAVFTAQGDASAPLTAPDLLVRLKAERVQAPEAAQVGDNVTYLYEFSVNQLQPVTIEVPLVVITFHGQPAWDITGRTGGLNVAGRTE
jgi:hypothetical protein